MAGITIVDFSTMNWLIFSVATIFQEHNISLLDIIKTNF